MTPSVYHKPRGWATAPILFFVEYYKAVAATLQGYEAREHTAQVPSNERQQREERFRNADLACALLFTHNGVGG